MLGAEASFVETAQAARDQIVTDGVAAMGADHATIMRAIRDTVRRDAIVVKDSTVAGIVWANRLLPVYEPRTTMRPVSESDRARPAAGDRRERRHRKAMRAGAGRRRVHAQHR